jgi:hypothetical protein
MDAGNSMDTGNSQRKQPDHSTMSWRARLPAQRLPDGVYLSRHQQPTVRSVDMVPKASAQWIPASFVPTSTVLVSDARVS